MKNDDLIVIATVHDPMLAEIMRNDLQANGIACEVSGTNFSAQLPGNPLQEVQLLIKAEDAGRAKQILEKHTKHHKG